MKDDKKKTLHIENRDFANDLIRVANDAQVPPLYHTTEIDGIIVKQYPFIRGNSAIYNRKEPFPKLDFDDDNLTDYTLLSALKNERENQIELHRKYCVDRYNHIKLATQLWLNEIIQGCTADVIEDTDMDVIRMFMAQIWTMQSWIMTGVEMDVIRKKLKDEPYYSPTVQVDPVKWFPMSFDIDELIEEIKSPVAAIERIVFRTVPLYFEYVNIQSILYKLDIKDLFDEMDQDAVYLEILNAAEGIREGKVALVQYVKEKFGCVKEETAFNKADEIHRRIRGTYLYKNFKGYQPTKSSVDMADVNKILNRVK